MSQPSCVALIPARAGSKRVPGKNVRLLAGHPLLAYTIRAALDSGVFGAVVVSTDSEETAAVARHYGAEVPFLRPSAFAGDLSPDIEWIQHALTSLSAAGRSFDAFSILRPTSPFRRADTLRRAWAAFTAQPEADSLRAVEPCKQHPAKMWTLEGELLKPLIQSPAGQTPWHSTPYQALPKVYVQNASLEIAWTKTVEATGTIAGDVILAFLTEGEEGYDLNDELDWHLAQELLRQGRARLPEIKVGALR